MADIEQRGKNKTNKQKKRDKMGVNKRQNSSDCSVLVLKKNKGKDNKAIIEFVLFFFPHFQ